MILYEIHIPQDGDEARIERVHGDNWLDALRRGLAAAGRPAPTRNLSFDLQEDESVIVTDSGSGAAYHVVPVAVRKRREAEEARLAALAADATPLDETGFRQPPLDLEDPFAEDPEAEQAVTGVEPMKLREEVEQARARRDSHPSLPPVRAQGRTPGHLETVDYVEEGLLESQEMSAIRVEPPSAPPRSSRHPMALALEGLETLPRDIFAASAFVLDLAMEHVPSGAGSILLIDARERCLYFAVARGPKTAELNTQRVPLEVGIAGACIRSRRSMNIDDPAHDPRFARSIADSVGHLPTNIIAAPILDGRRAFGVLELLDRQGRKGFTQADERLARRAARTLGRYFSSLLPSKKS